MISPRMCEFQKTHTLILHFYLLVLHSHLSGLEVCTYFVQQQYNRVLPLVHYAKTWNGCAQISRVGPIRAKFTSTHIKLPGAGRVTWSKLHMQNTRILGSTVQKFWYTPMCVCVCVYIYIYIYIYIHLNLEDIITATAIINKYVCTLMHENKCL